MNYAGSIITLEYKIISKYVPLISVFFKTFMLIGTHIINHNLSRGKLWSEKLHLSNTSL